MPIDKLTSDAADQPINYSLKSQESNETHTPMSSSHQHPQHVQRQEQNVCIVLFSRLSNKIHKITVCSYIFKYIFLDPTHMR
ncbi:hypothetical protein DOY81_011165 [Sarcophaga bullata]|nr:hypothetical protein DOY81_011165 [Sarcophaga bullata]